MNKTFARLVAEARASRNIEERLSCGGHYEHITPRSAVAADWLFALDEARADLANDVRHLSNPDEPLARRAAQKHLAQISAIAEAMAGRLRNLC